MKKIITIILSAIMLVCCIQPIKAETTTISNYAELKAFLESSDSVATASIAANATINVTDTITIEDDKTRTLNILDGVVINAPSTGHAMFVVGENASFTITAIGTNKTVAFVGEANPTEQIQSKGVFISANEGSSVSISGVSIKNFTSPIADDANLPYGAINIYSGQLTLDYVTMSNNKARYGAAINASRCNVNIDHSKFENNIAYRGAALHLSDSITSNTNSITIKNSSFTSNYAESESVGWGGAIYSQETTLDIYNCQFSQNNATLSGAALYVNGGTASLTNTIVKENIANDAAAIHIRKYGLEATNLYLKSGTKIIDNNASSQSAIYAEGATIIFDGQDILLDNYNSKKEKDDIVLNAPMVVKTGTTVTKRVAIKTSGEIPDDLYPYLCATKDEYNGSLKDIFTVAIGNNNLKETPEGLQIEKYGLKQEPQLENNFTVEVDDVSDTDIQVSYQWCYREIENSEKIEDASKEYKMFDELLINSNIEYKNGKHIIPSNGIGLTYNKEYLPVNYILCNVKKGQTLAIKANAINEANEEMTSYLMILDYDNLIAYMLVDSDGYVPLNEKITIKEDGNLYIGIFYTGGAEITDFTLMQYGETKKLSAKEKYLTQAIGDKAMFCRVSFTNDNHTKVLETENINFATPKTGNNQRFDLGEKSPLNFKLEANDTQYQDFIDTGKVYLDAFDTSNELKRDVDYSFVKGSIDISINSDIVKNLSVGMHTIYVVENHSDTLTQRITAITFNVGKDIVPTSSDSNFMIVKLFGLIGVVTSAIYVTNKRKKSIDE